MPPYPPPNLLVCITYTETHHGVGFSWTCLAISKDAGVVTLKGRLENIFSEITENLVGLTEEV